MKGDVLATGTGMGDDTEAGQEPELERSPPATDAHEAHDEHSNNNDDDENDDENEPLVVHRRPQHAPDANSMDDNDHSPLDFSASATSPPTSPTTTTNLVEFFAHFFLRTKGTKAIVLVTIFYGLGVGCTTGLIPALLMDRYARLHHGYTGPYCDSNDGGRKIPPPACQAGNDEAQAAAAWANGVVSLVGLVLHPLLGSLSDRYGRRPVVLASVAAVLLPCAAVWALLVVPTLSPTWYFAAYSLATGVFDLVGLVFACLSDCLPDHMRAQGFGVFLSLFYLAYALGPSLPVVLSGHVQTAVASCVLVLMGCLLAVFFLPETLSEAARRQAQRHRQRERQDLVGLPDLSSKWCPCLGPPILRDVAILGRDRTLALLAGGSFFSSMVFAADRTLVLFYIEEHLDVDDADIASMFLVLGFAALVLQGGAIQPLVRCLGERGLLVATFACGTLHNSLYGLARSKRTITVAIALAQFTKINTPVLSSLASQDTTPQEQGRIQGALAAVNALGLSIGPLTMEFVYHLTKDRRHFGPGFMFYFAALLYAVGTVLVALVPGASTEERLDENFESDELERSRSLEEPLLLSRQIAKHPDIPVDGEAL